MEKQIRQITSHRFKQNTAGFRSVDMFHTEFQFEPFLVFTEFYMNRPVFGPHPHAGVSVMTYMLPDSKGSFLNRDSRGDHSIIEPGGVHVTQAGRGIKHDEAPTVPGTDCHGFQIWINHADKDRLVEPKAFHALPIEVPEWSTANIHLRVIQGCYGNKASSIQLVTKTSVYDVTLRPDSEIEFEAEEMAFIYVISGEVFVRDRIATSSSMVSFEKPGYKVRVKTGARTANFIFATATPLNEPIVHGGPFVMTTAQQMLETTHRLQRGEMGTLDPL